MRVPAIPKHKFLPFVAEQGWVKIPSPPKPEFEDGRWQARLNGIDCVVVAYRNKKNSNLRLAIQGVNVKQADKLTDALYRAYFAAQRARPQGGRR